VGPTEDPAKVERAVRNLFPAASVESDGRTVRARAEGREGLRRLRELVQVQRTGSSVAGALRPRASGRAVRFQLNRLAAFANHVNLGPSAMGPIEVELEDDDLEGLIEWLCGRTS
jgi:predicted RNA binding protein with dsRBD fold (UPF0201 family)